MYDLLEQDASRLEEINLRLSWLMRKRNEQELDRFGLTMPQYMALSCIQRNTRGCSMSELAESSHQLSATMTGIIDRLVDRGLVLRERDPHDRRALRVALTEEGCRVIDQVNDSQRQRMRALLGVIPAEERQQIIETFARYLRAVEGAEAAAALERTQAAPERTQAAPERTQAVAE